MNTNPQNSARVNLALGTISFTVCFAAWGLISAFAPAFRAEFQLSAKTYRLNQLCYDLRKLKGHGLLQRDGSRYAYHLTAKGLQVALLFLFFHKLLCGPLANSRFHHKPDPKHCPKSKLEVDPTLQKRLCDVLAKCNTIKTAAAVCRVSEKSIYSWISKYPSFAKAIE